MLDHLTKIHLIRNATLRITYAGMTFLLDPMLSDKLALESFVGKSRNPTVDLPIPISDVLRDIDAVVVSHMHVDHFDPVARKVIPDDMQLFCQPSDVPALGAGGFVNILVSPYTSSSLFLIAVNSSGSCLSLLIASVSSCSFCAES